MSPAAGGAGGGEHEDALIGRVINERVKIVRTIARGGMGKVYLGEQVSMGRPCAVKVLDPHVAQAEGEDFAKRFLLEASVNAKLKHPNVVTIFDYGETEEGLCFIAMEYLEGKTLAQELKDHGRLDPKRAVEIIRQVCRALREAHALGVVHRDMKPGNVFLVNHADEGDFAKVLDFGLVKETRADGADQHTQMGQIMGSPRYMAPEQIQGKSVDGRTDIYALGAMLFAMITGRPPFDRPNEMATMMAHVSEPVPLLGDVVPGLMLPGGLEEVVYRCLEKDPNKRYASMEELIVALKLQGNPTAMSSSSGAYAAVTGSGMHASLSTSSGSLPVVQSAAPAPRKSPTAAIIVALVAVAIAGGVFVMMRHEDPAVTNGGGGSSSSVALTSASSAPTASETASVAPPATVPSAVLHIETEPPGARVKEDGLEICSSTPCDVVYKGESGDSGVEHLLEFTKSDYRVERKLVKATHYPYFLKMTRSR